ncbi:hypothetical protein BMS3Bbin02_01751 [bacterium BMS3Bbin02]|nr:hypothetical protein BMS3Bbin02_01751 [bacterium BMS3Bbin02]
MVDAAAPVIGDRVPGIHCVRVVRVPPNTVAGVVADDIARDHDIGGVDELDARLILRAVAVVVYLVVGDRDVRYIREDDRLVVVVVYPAPRDRTAVGDGDPVVLVVIDDAI